jgi:hypothetical protein
MIFSSSQLTAANVTSDIADLQNPSQTDSLIGITSTTGGLSPERVKIFKSSLLSVIKLTREQDCSLDQVLSEANRTTNPRFSIEEAEAILREMETSNLCMYREGHIYLCS